MKKIILLILISILMTGCAGLYNVNGFILPNDFEFLTLIKKLDEPEKIVNYMKYNFEYEAHISYHLTPYQLYIIRRGDCDDFSTFGTFVANYHGYETYRIKIFYKNTVYNHSLAIYKENNKYNYSDNQQYFPINHDNFSDIVKHDGYYICNFYGYIWRKYTVYDYRNEEIETGYNN